MARVKDGFKLGQPQTLFQATKKTRNGWVCAGFVVVGRIVRLTAPILSWPVGGLDIYAALHLLRKRGYRIEVVASSLQKNGF